MRLTGLMFAGATLQPSSKQSHSAQPAHFASNSITPRKALTSDIATFSNKSHQSQPLF